MIIVDKNKIDDDFNIKHILTVVCDCHNCKIKDIKKRECITITENNRKECLNKYKSYGWYFIKNKKTNIYEAWAPDHFWN